MVFEELRCEPRGPLGGADRVRDRRAPDAGRRRDGAAPRRRRPRPAGGGSTSVRSRGSAASRSSSGSSSRRSRSSRSTARCAGSCSAPRSPASSARSTTSAASTRSRSSAARSPPRRSRVAFGVWIDHFTFPFLGVVDLPAVRRDAAHGRLDRRGDEHGQLPRRDGRARGGRLRDRRPDVRDPRALAREGRRRDPLRDRRGRVHRLPAPQLLPGADLHGRLGRARARLHAGHDLDRGSPEDGVDRRPVPAAARARGADHRHVVRRREAAQVRPADLVARPLPPPSPLHEHRLLAAARGADDVGVDREPRRRRARDALHPVPRGRGVARRGRRSPSPRSRSARSRSRSTSCTCSRSSSSRTRASGAPARGGRGHRSGCSA